MKEFYWLRFLLYSWIVVLIDSVPVDITNHEEMKKIVNSCVGTKFISKWWVTDKW